jgi:hypothetical protein
MTSEVGQESRSSERMGGYDQFISLLFYILQIIYVHTCCFIYSHKFIQSVLSYYIITCLMPDHTSNMINLFVLILQLCCCYLFIFSCSIIIHVPCLYAYYIYMIHMLYVLLIHIVMDIFEIVISMIKHILYIIIIMLIYRIKMIWKMPIFLTVSPTFQNNVFCIACVLPSGSTPARRSSLSKRQRIMILWVRPSLTGSLKYPVP